MKTFFTVLLFFALSIPLCAQQAIDYRSRTVYFIVTDRFHAHGPYKPYVDLQYPDATNAMNCFNMLCSKEEQWRKYWGGDIHGVIEKLDYLRALGASAVWVTPLMENVRAYEGGTAYGTGYHGYWVQNYDRPNPHFGTWNDVGLLSDQLHARSMRYIQDITLNHSNPFDNHVNGGCIDLKMRTRYSSILMMTTSIRRQFQVRLGQTVLAIGSPEGLDHTVTKGIVSAVGRQPSLNRPMIYVQTDAPINPGNSGGPLIDRNGNLVGINTFIYTSGGGSEGLGFAIPEPIVRFVYNELKSHGKVRSITIGAHAQGITPILASGLKLSRDSGVILSDVDPLGPAATAGLHSGDVVTSIDGAPIDSLPKYTAYIYVHPRERPMEVQVLREGKAITKSVVPVDQPPPIEDLSGLINLKTDLITPLGIFAIDLKEPLANAMGMRSKSGVLVAAMLGEEPAILAELQTGDVIRSMNGRAVMDTDALRRGLSSFKLGDAVVFEVERQSIFQYVALEIE